MARTPLEEPFAYEANAQELASYRAARTAVGGMQAPLLLESRNQNNRMFVAGFDGTGNDLHQDDPKHHTAVAKVYRQVLEAETSVDGIAGGYVAGPGTQQNFLEKFRDRVFGDTVEERVERMYEMFIKQSKEWLDANPHAEIRIASIGFSRGAEEAALFTRMVHERGIQNPEGAVYTRDEDGSITDVSYKRAPLVAPGQTAQAVALLDPVSTGRARDLDRRLPPSVISGFQISADDEKRDQYKVTDHLDPGYSEDRRFLHVTVAGAHSDIGDWYARNGLGIRSTNLVVDYLNALSDRPFLTKRAEPDDPRLNVVHRSDLSWIPFTKFSTLDGERNHRQEVAPPALCRIGAVRDCWNKEPMDTSLDRQFEHRAVPIAQLPASLVSAAQEGPLHEAHPRRNPIDVMFEGLGRAALARDTADMRSIGRDYLASPTGQGWRMQGAERDQPAREPVPIAVEASGPMFEAPRIRALQH